MEKLILGTLIVYAIGFVVMTAITFGTGGEHHIRKGEWKWIWFNLSIWPFWISLVIWWTIKDYFKRKPDKKDVPLNGMKAYDQGYKLTDNPYRQNTPDHSIWRDDWLFCNGTFKEKSK